MVSASSIDSQFAVQKLFWLGAICILCLVLGYLLPSNAYGMVMVIAAIGWLMTIPYHANLSLVLAVVTFKSALIFPYFPGRPFLWEFAALLAWSGLVIVFFLRQYPPDTSRLIRENKWLFVGAVGYCITLLMIMHFRGFGLRILGSEQMGGRFYFQQLTCAIFILLFLMQKVDNRTLMILFILQCLFTTTYLISDFVYSIAPQSLLWVLSFFELPGDAFNFEMQSQRFGIRRFQSLSILGGGLFFLFLVAVPLKRLLTPRGLWLIPIMASIFFLGILSGHRYLVMMVVGVLFFAAYSQRIFTLRNNILAVALLGIALVFAYSFARYLPLSAQRALSMLPNIEINARARSDGAGTLEVRRLMRNIGYDMMPQYFWLGRGFGQASADYSHLWDPTTITMHINQGRFYNGFVGLMVNTGIPGTAAMLLFLAGGTGLVYRVVRLLRTHMWDDPFSRMTGVISGIWLTSTLAFLFLHGDSEFAMKTFSLLAGMLLACYRALNEKALASAEA